MRPTRANLLRLTCVGFNEPGALQAPTFIAATAVQVF